MNIAYKKCRVEGMWRKSRMIWSFQTELDEDFQTKLMLLTEVTVQMAERN